MQHIINDSHISTGWNIRRWHSILFEKLATSKVDNDLIEIEFVMPRSEWMSFYLFRFFSREIELSDRFGSHAITTHANDHFPNSAYFIIIFYQLSVFHILTVNY